MHYVCHFLFFFQTAVCLDHLQAHQVEYPELLLLSLLFLFRFFAPWWDGCGIISWNRGMSIQLIITKKRKVEWIVQSKIPAWKNQTLSVPKLANRVPKSCQNYHDDFTLKSVEKKFFSLYQNSIKNGSRSSLGPKEARKNHF